jgi:hypothetical protein
MRLISWTLRSGSEQKRLVISIQYIYIYVYICIYIYMYIYVYIYIYISKKVNFILQEHLPTQRGYVQSR